MKNFKLIFTLVICALILVGASGCGLLNSRQIIKEDNTPKTEEKKEESKDESTDLKDADSLTCTKKSSEGSETVVINHKGEKIVQIQQTSIEQVDKDSIDFSVGAINLVSAMFSAVDGIDVKGSKEGSDKVKMVMTINFEKLDKEALKTLVTDDDDEGFYTADQYKFSELKKELSSEYECK